MLGVFSKQANIQIMEIGGMLIDALIEFVQGPCSGNQKALITAKIIDNCRDFLAGYQEVGYEAEMKSKGFDFNNAEHLEIINETKQKLVTLLVALLEGIPENYVINKMSQSLDFTLIKDRMYYVYKNFVIELMNIKNPIDETIINLPITTVNNNLKLNSFEGAVLEGFDIHALLEILKVYSKNSRHNSDELRFTASQKQANNFFAAHTGRIEVNVKNSEAAQRKNSMTTAMSFKLQRTYFPIKPVCHYLVQNKKDKFKFEADRTSPNTKIRSLMECSKTIIMEMYHDAKVDNNWCMISPKTVERIRDLTTFLAVISNIIMLIFFQTDDDEDYKGIEYHETAGLIIDIICVFQMIGSLLVISSYTLSNGPLILRHKWEEHVSEQKKKVGNHDEILENIFLTINSTFSEISPEQERLLLHLEGPYSDKVKDVKAVKNIDYYIISMTFICTDGSFVYYLFYSTVSVLAFVISPIYHTFLLLDFAVRFDTLKNITKNKVALGMTSMLILIILFIYASVGFFFFHDMMYTYEINSYDSDTIGESL